ncbi:MAG: hypothetical protein ACJ8GN_08805 [Longimicrobiaceae bacterium]
MVETVAAYLGILDIVVRLARYGDRRLRQGILTAFRAVSEPVQHPSIDEARRTFQAELVRQLGADRARPIQRAIQVVEEVVSKSFDPVILDTQQILPYGTLLNRIVTAVGLHLNQLRVIEAWKAFEWLGADKKTTTRFLLLPYTWQLLGLCQPRFRKSKKDSCLSLRQQIQQPYMGWGPKYELAMVITRPSKLSWLVERPSKTPERADVSFASDYNLVFGSEWSSKRFGVPHEINIESIVFEALLLGLLMDAIAYDKRAISEIHQSKSFIRSLLGFGRDEMIPPF